MVFSLVTAPISPPAALLSCKNQAIPPTARASAESAYTTQMVAGVAQHLLWVCKVLVLVKSPPNFVDSNQGRIGVKGGLLLAAAFERNEGLFSSGYRLGGWQPVLLPPNGNTIAIGINRNCVT